jgi:hypothetical protein
MPRIPDFNIPSVQVQPVDMPAMQGPGVAPMQNAAPEQMQQMGQGMMQFGKGMADIGMRLQDVLNDSVVAEYDNKWRNILNDEAVKFQSLQGRDAIAGYKGFQENIAKQRRDVELGLTNEAQKMAFRNMADRRMLDIDRQANFHVTKETYNFKVSETQARIQNMLDDAIDYGSKAYDPGVPPSVKMLDGTTGLISDKTVSAIVEGARKNNADAFQTRYSGLMNQARDHLSFQGIDPDDEQGKLYMKNVETGLYTGVLNRMVQNNDTNSARMFLANKNNRSKVDPETLYKTENALSKLRKSDVADDVSRAIFTRDDLPTIQDKQNFARAAFIAGHLDKEDLASTLSAINTLSENEKEASLQQQLQLLNLAKTKFRAATQGLGFSKDQSAGNALLRLDKELYIRLGEEGLTKFETWVREGYQEKTNPTHRAELLKMMEDQPDLFSSITPTELAFNWQLSAEDQDLFGARIKDANNTATAADRQLMSDKEVLLKQYRKETGNYTNKDDYIESTEEFSKWQDKIQAQWSAFKSSAENKNANLVDFLSARDTTQVVVDGKVEPLYKLPEGEVGAFRVAIPNTNKSVDVLPGDIPSWDRRQIVDAIRTANENPFRVYRRVVDDNGAEKLVLHQRADGSTALHSSVSDALSEARSLGSEFLVRKAEQLPSDEQTIATRWVHGISQRGDDVGRYVSLVRRRADLDNRVKAQGAASLEEYMRRFVDNPNSLVFIPGLIEQLNLQEEIKGMPDVMDKMSEGDRYATKDDRIVADINAISFYSRYGEPKGLRGRQYNTGPKYDLDKIKYSEKQLSDFVKFGIPKNDLVAKRLFGYILTTAPSWWSKGDTARYQEAYQSVRGVDAFEILQRIAKNIGMEVSPELAERHRQLSLKDNNYPAVTASVQARAQLANITSQQRKQFASDIRAASWRKGSYIWHLANTPQDVLSNFAGPFQPENGYSPRESKAPTRNAIPPSPLGVSLIQDLQREIAAERLNLQIKQFANPTEGGGDSSTIQELERMIELINSGDYSFAEQWRSKNETVDKAFKSVFPNGIPK